MTNYKKSLLSLAAVLALGTGANAANTYIPFSSDSVDNKWTMFGVEGFMNIEGTTATTEFTTTAGWDATLNDASADDVATSGMTVVGDDMMTIKALPNVSASNKITTATINMLKTGMVFSDTEPMRSMYVKVGNDTEANLYVTYKSSLEGETVEVQSSDIANTTFSFELDALKTFDDPAAAPEKTGDEDTNATLITGVADLMDYDFTNNPKNTGNFSEDTDRDDAPRTETNVRIYGYDALGTNWEIYDSQSAAVSGANDFTDLEAGRGYWAKLDMDGDNTNGTTAGGITARAGGATLATGAIVDADYNASRIDTGWNLISFDSDKPLIRTASTGLVIASNSIAGEITIIDSTGVNSIDVALNLNDEEADARAINMAVEQAQERGDFPDTFNLRAFVSGATNLVLVSNKRFTVTDGTDGLDNLGAAKTLAGLDPWSTFDNDVRAVTIGEIGDLTGAEGARSVYGEYALLVEPLYAAGAASQADNLAGDGVQPAAILINDSTSGASSGLALLNDAGDTVAAIGDTITTLNTAITNQPDVDGTAASALGRSLPIDFNLDTTDTHILIASDTKFYVRDHTFTRSFTFDVTVGVAGDLNLIGTDSDQAIAATAAIATTADAINGAAGAVQTLTGVFATDIDADTLVLTSASPTAGVNFNMYDSSDEYIEDDLSTSDISQQGAIANVFNIDKLAAEPVTKHLVSITIAQGDLDTATDNVAIDTVDINGLGVNTNISANMPVDPAGNDADRLIALDAIVAELKLQAVNNGLDASVYHDFNSTTGLPVNPTITVEGYGISTVDINLAAAGAVNTADTNVASYGAIINTTGNVADLKYNAYHTPDFAKDGPLYTLEKAGYTPISIISGNANMQTAGAGIAWDSIDLTRTPSEMFADQDYNLFSIDGKAGYWVYLEENTASNDINITLKTNGLVPTYTHHFNADGTVSNTVKANLYVLVTGLPAVPSGEVSTSTVYASVGGESIELVGDSSDPEWTATLSGFELDDVYASNAITVSASNGQGQSLLTQSLGSIDVTAPQPPVINVGAGGDSFSIDANVTDDDVAGFYVFQGSVPEDEIDVVDASGATGYISWMDAAGGSLDFCSSDDITFGTQLTLLAMAVDGEGNFTLGNVSETETFTYSPIFKGSSVLSHLGDGTDPDQIAVPYAANCAEDTDNPVTADSAVSLKSVTTNVVSYMSYAAKDVVFGLDIPLTIYLEDAPGGNMVEIQYSAAYATEAFYVEIDGQIWSAVFPGDDDTYGDANAPADLSDTAGDLAAIGGSLVADQTFN